MADASRLRPRSLRWRLTLAVGGVLVLAFVGTFLVVYGTTEARLRGRLDSELRTAAMGFAAAVAPAAAANRTAEQLAATAERYVNTQKFSTSSRLLYAIAGRRIATNEPELVGLSAGHLDRDDIPATAHREARFGAALLASAPGLSTLIAPDVGRLRLFVRRLPAGTNGPLTIGVGEPLAPIEDALDGIVASFAVGGSLMLLGALLAGFLLAAGFARPLRRMARIAARVDAGDLTPRIDARGARNETRVLADAFDHMLDRLEEAFARQRAFVADASHELRTPLTAIRGQLEVLARSEDPTAEDVRRVQRLVQSEVERMTRLTEDLLLLAHTDESRPLHRESVELVAFLEELLAATQAGADRRRSLDAVAANGLLSADRDRLAQALRNLLRNAEEHTHAGGAIVLGARAAPEGRVQIWVDDDGPGIPPSEREHVFDRFHRADAARARNAGGTGLGLAIVQALVEAHGGRAWAAASPLGGARVVVELPGFRRSEY